MKRLIFLVFISYGCSALAPIQRGKLISVFHLIEIAQYEEAKNVIEEMITDKVYKKWPKTWYARGLICQNAYQEGIKKKDKKKTELYPDQLFVAYESFEKARSLDKRGRLEKQLAPKYVLLANDLRALGETNYNSKKYEDALKAFEQSIEISQSSILSAVTDTSLIYNAALASYELKDKQKAIEYFTTLHNLKYSPNATHLLFTLFLGKKDTAMAENILLEGVENYGNNVDMALLLVDLLFHRGETDKAIGFLDSISLKSPDQYMLPYTKGLILQKTENYTEAIEAYEKAVSIAPDELKSYVNIATCYYNIGVDIEEKARALTNKRMFLEEKIKSASAFESAISWLDKVYEKKPKDKLIMADLYDLYKSLRVTDKSKSIEKQLN